MRNQWQAMDEETLAALRRQASERQRLQYLESMILLLRQKLEEMRKDIYGGIRVTQSWAFQPGRPGVGDPTAAVAVRASDIEGQEEFERTEKRLRALTRERDRLRLKQELFDCSLRALPEEERFLVEVRVMENRPWSAVENLYENQYGIRLHRDTLRRRLSAAVHVMGEMGKEA